MSARKDRAEAKLARRVAAHEASANKKAANAKGYTKPGSQNRHKS